MKRPTRLPKSNSNGTRYACPQHLNAGAVGGSLAPSTRMHLPLWPDKVLFKDRSGEMGTRSHHGPYKAFIAGGSVVPSDHTDLEMGGRPRSDFLIRRGRGLARDGGDPRGMCDEVCVAHPFSTSRTNSFLRDLRIP